MTCMQLIAVVCKFASSLVPFPQCLNWDLNFTAGGCQLRVALQSIALPRTGVRRCPCRFPTNALKITKKISTSQTVSEVQSKTRRQESEASVQMRSNWFCVSTSTTTQTCGHFHHFSEWSSVVEEDYISAQTQASITPPSKTHGPMKNAPV